MSAGLGRKSGKKRGQEDRPFASELHRARALAEEAIGQQRATAEILRVISSSPSDVQPVFRSILSNASRLCEASVGAVFLFDGDALTAVAHRNASDEFADFLKHSHPRPSRETTTRRCALERRTMHTADLLNDPEYTPLDFHRRENVRTVLSVPMIRDDRLVGVITLWRREVKPFTDRQVALVQTFADQAVIAIENVRLLKETQEALEQQKASAEVLGAISSSISDTAPVFDKIIESCGRLFAGRIVGLNLVGEDGMLRMGAYHGAHRDDFERIFPSTVTVESGSGLSIIERRVVHFPDVERGEGVPARTRRGCETLGIKSVIFAPVLWEGRGMGAIWVGRDHVAPFSRKEIALLRTFADQAAIAIENVRLFNETREALKQQTATAEILHVISSSPTDVQPVFEAIVRSGVRLFEGAGVTVARPENGEVRLMAIAERDPERVRRWTERFPFPLTREYMHGVAILDCRMVDMPDVELMDERFAAGKRNFAASGYRAMTVVPMVKDGAAIGTIAVVRDAPGPLSDKQIALLQTFADQAVIAIENARLFNETREALEQQKASAEVLGAISSSIADTAPVFDKILESCERLFAGRIVGLNLVGEDGLLHLGAYHGVHREEFERTFPYPVTAESGSGLSIVERRVVRFPDAEHGEGVPERTRHGCRTLGIKSVIFAPLLWEGRGMGAIFVGRDRVSSFSDKEIALLRIFADQAAIAIENVRLFNEIEEKSRQLEVASRHKSEFLANMSHELRTPLNAIIGFTRIVMRRSQERLEPVQYENLEKILSSGQHLLALINSILDLAKVEAGRVEVNPRDVDLSPVLESCARTVEPLVRTDAVTLVKEFDGTLPRMIVDEEKLRQIVINLLSNAAKFTSRGSIRLQAQASDGTVAIAVSDTGIGIPPDKLEAIFEEFAQADASSTRVYGGTGLGLTIARRLARLMDGEITAESVLGSGSKFTLTLPIRYASPGA